jgi:hypothetical protein
MGNIGGLTLCSTAHLHPQWHVTNQASWRGVPVLCKPLFCWVWAGWLTARATFRVCLKPCVPRTAVRCFPATNLDFYIVLRHQASTILENTRQPGRDRQRRKELVAQLLARCRDLPEQPSSIGGVQVAWLGNEADACHEQRGPSAIGARQTGGQPHTEVAGPFLAPQGTTQGTQGTQGEQKFGQGVHLPLATTFCSRRPPLRIT